MTEVSLTTPALTPNHMGRQPLSLEPPSGRLRVLVITSCTGEKRHKTANQLTLEDFQDLQKLRERQQSLEEFALPCGLMYTGQQHQRAMQGVNLLRSCFGKEVVDVKIISAGYGLIDENQTIVPYSVTFNAMKDRVVDKWAQFLRIHEGFERAIIGYDLIFVLLGDKYLRALNLPVETNFNQTFIFLASPKSAAYIKVKNSKTFILKLNNADASRFGCALVGLKGHLLKIFAHQIASQPDLIQKVYQEPDTFTQFIDTVPIQLELSLGISIEPKPKAKAKKITMQSSAYDLSRIYTLPPAVNKHLAMRYFIPEWDDRVDAGFDFQNDAFTQDRNAYKDDIYAHEIYSKPNYDGILVSKIVIDKSSRKKADIEAFGGIHHFIRTESEVMGDCGAFGYIAEVEPPYKTDEILEYYEKLGFDYGVSIDHLIVGPFAQPGIREKRYELTQKNAFEFIEQHQRRGYKFTPIGVAQGWSPESYAEAVKSLVEIGYDYIGLGGLARAQSIEILEILQAVYVHLTPNTRLHLFGVGRIDLVPYLRHLGVTSFDSAGPLRSAWLDSNANYHSMNGKKYAAVRIPFVDKHSPRIKHLLENGFERNYLQTLEQNALKALREFDKENLSIDETLQTLLAYDELLELPRDGKVEPKAKERRQKLHEIMYKKLLQDKPWKQCDCEICKTIGVEAIIFRGNDRNRRRGFHNTYVFYKRFQEFLQSEKQNDT
jgi:hypothetical protein